MKSKEDVKTRFACIGIVVFVRKVNVTMSILMKTVYIHLQWWTSRYSKCRDKEGQTRTIRDRQGQTRTDKDRQGQAGTDRDRQVQTGTDKDKQGQAWTERNSQGQVWTIRDRNTLSLFVPVFPCLSLHCPGLSLLCPCLYLLVPALSLALTGIRGSYSSAQLDQ